MIGPRGKLTVLNRACDPQCQRCVLHQVNKHVCTMGRGNPMAKLLLVGEAPGQDEAISGQVFTGRTGKWLVNKLTELNILDNVYITNAVKCHPPENRTPERGEIAACSRFLQAEIRTVDPKVILMMGKTARAAVDKICLEKGEPYWSTNHGCYVMWTWHPSFVMRFSKADKKFEEEFVTSLVRAYDVAYYWFSE